MGTSSSKLKAKQEIAKSVNVLQGKSGENNHNDVPVKRDSSAKASRLSDIGKRTSFYEMVDANEVLPYLIVGKYKRFVYS